MENVTLINEYYGIINNDPNVYDKKFKLAQNHDNLITALNTTHLFPLYRDETVNISFEFTFYREGQFMATDIVKCNNVSSRDTVLKRFRKKTAKRILKWI